MKNTTNLDQHLIAYSDENIYSLDNRLLLNWYPKRIIKKTPSVNSCLELGIGHGYTTNIFSQHFKRYIVLDGSKAIIENFKNNFSDNKAEIIETYFENFETDEKFDVIILGFVLEHVDNPQEILVKYKKFLMPGGKIFLTVPNATSLNRQIGNYAGLLPDILELTQNDINLGHKRFYTVEKIKTEIEDAGYILKNIEGLYLKPFTTAQIKSLNFDNKIFDAMCEAGINYPELCCAIMAEIEVAKG